MAMVWYDTSNYVYIHILIYSEREMYVKSNWVESNESSLIYLFSYFFMSILDTQLPFGAKLLKLLDRAPSGRFEFFALLLPGNDVPQVSPRNPGSLRKSPVFFPETQWQIWRIHCNPHVWANEVWLRGSLNLMRIPMKLLVKTRPSNTREFGYCWDRKHNEMGASEPQRRAVRILA